MPVAAAAAVSKTPRIVNNPESSHSTRVKECATSSTRDARSKSVVKLREIKKPDLTPLRSSKFQIKIPEKNIKESLEKCNSEIPVPASWRDSNPDVQVRKGSYAKNDVPVEDAAQVDRELSLEEKMKILKEQEGCVPNCRYFRSTEKVELKNNAANVREGVPDWIKKSLEIVPPVGHVEGSQCSISPIGERLNRKSQAACLWHEEFSNSRGRLAKDIFLTSSTASELDPIKPMSSILRVAVPPVVNAPRRINQKQQVHNLEKGGHAAIRDKCLDYSILAECMERQHNVSKLNNGAWMLLCKGILHDNAQEYNHALENYKKCLKLFKETRDIKGEAMIYNFMACSLQEDQDLKLAASQSISPSKKLEIPTSAIIQYEKAAEYHKLHAEIASLEGKFVAFTNLGLLYEMLGSWEEAAKFHQQALKCATLNERPEDQGTAVGNLGYLLYSRNQCDTAKACMTRYLQICLALKNVQGQVKAYYVLGCIASKRNEIFNAVKEFKAARRSATLIGDKTIESLAKVMIGVMTGNGELAKQKESCEVDFNVS